MGMKEVEQFGKSFDHISMGRNRYETWSDFITITACAISNAVRFNQSREDMYLNVINKYQPKEQQMFAETVGVYFKLVDENPFQDMLGDLYMRLELGSSAAGQFFTPYNVCRMMAKCEVDNALSEIERKGWISANDCACGGGATLIAMADALHERGCNYQQSVLFTGQDLLANTAMMCYIQLSMLGCAGYIKIGDTLSDPITGDTLFAPEGNSIWITPMYYSDVWTGRRTAHMMDRMMQKANAVTKNHKETPVLPKKKTISVTTKPAEEIKLQQISMF